MLSEFVTQKKKRTVNAEIIIRLYEFWYMLAASIDLPGRSGCMFPL